MLSDEWRGWGERKSHQRFWNVTSYKNPVLIWARSTIPRQRTRITVDNRKGGVNWKTQPFWFTLQSAFELVLLLSHRFRPFCSSDKTGYDQIWVIYRMPEERLWSMHSPTDRETCVHLLRSHEWCKHASDGFDHRGSANNHWSWRTGWCLHFIVVQTFHAAREPTGYAFMCKTLASGIDMSAERRP